MYPFAKLLRRKNIPQRLRPSRRVGRKKSAGIPSPGAILRQPLAYALGLTLALALLRLGSLTLELLLPLWEEELRRRFALPEPRGHRLISLAGQLLERLGRGLGLFSAAPEAAEVATGAASGESESQRALERARCEENAARLRLEAARLERETAATPPAPATPWLRSLGALIFNTLVGTAVSALVSRGLKAMLDGGGGDEASRRHRSDLAWQLREQGEALSRQLASASLAAEDTTLRSGAQLLEQQLANGSYLRAQHLSLETLASEQRTAWEELGRGLTLVNENLGRLQQNLLAAHPPACPPPAAEALAPELPWQEFCRQALAAAPGSQGGRNLAEQLAPVAPAAALLTLGLATTLSLSLLGNAPAPPAAEVSGEAELTPPLPSPPALQPLAPLELFANPPAEISSASALTFSLAEADAVSAASTSLLRQSPEVLANALRAQRRLSPALAAALEEQVAEHRPNVASLRALNPENYGSGSSGPWLGPLLAFLGKRPTLGRLLLSAGALGGSYALRTLASLALEALLPGFDLGPATAPKLSHTPAAENPPAVAARHSSKLTASEELGDTPSLATEALALLAHALDSLAALLRRWGDR